MPDEPITNAELARRLDDRVGTLRDDIHDLKTEVSKLVPREVYDAHRATTRTEMEALRAQVAALESRSRWLIAAVIVPILVVILNAVLTAKGVKP